MAAYKKLYEEEKAKNEALQKQLDELTSLDGMCDLLEPGQAKDFVLQFADRCSNRAEVNMLIRVANKLGA